MKPTILLYDSGMGGLTIYDAIRQSLPDAHYLYCFDNAYFPYSEKTEDFLIQRAELIVQTIARNYPLDMVVVACNTASTVVLPTLREKFSFHVVGTVPAIKPAAAISKTGKIGLLATKGTVNRQYVSDLIQTYASHHQIEKIGTTDLVELVEEKQQTGFVDMQRLKEIILPWRDEMDLDTVILGCTHFPLVKEELMQLLPQVKYFIDPGNGIAKRVVTLLSNELKLNNSEKVDKYNQAFCTKRTEDFEQRKNVMKNWQFENLTVLDL
ncbi:glutamate racemase [Otariodibacter oris]|uniref:Glutamate racemase n=1 Tax=Otariodibacter oris TaxID=1032623 RepID=A0A420XF90_9PAST|nr:glutamate racemase [Otariodibacter oris]QGM81544.1 glutamate racemase [Otariodibacter oris]RKR71154.1 glutamate racemase [Otariodibacter oris]